MHLLTDERLLKALADAIVVHPLATLKELAEAAGVSKATLHRFCGTRDNLVNMRATKCLVWVLRWRSISPPLKMLWRTQKKPQGIGP